MTQLSEMDVLLNRAAVPLRFMLSHPYRCLSVHIPKSAGNSVNRAFGIGWQDHKDLARYRAELSPEVFDAYFKFTIVRNPWDRLLSDYNYQKKKSRPADSKLLLFDERGRRRGFSEWAELALNSPEACPAGKWGGEVSAGIHRFSPQLDWISIEGQVRVDFIAKLETLEKDFTVIRSAVGLGTARLPRRNRRFHFHYSWYYDDRTRDLVGRYYARDIEAFGYEFEDYRLRSWWFGGKRRRAERSLTRAAPPIGAMPMRTGAMIPPGHVPG